MINQKEIIAFRCKECKETIDKGLCGNHREETGHKEFEPGYKDVESKDNTKKLKGGKDK